MRKFKNIENDEVFTYEELIEEYCKLVKENGQTEEYYLYTSFEKWLEECLGKNGSLKEIFPHKWKINCTITITGEDNDETSYDAVERLLTLTDPDLDINVNRVEWEAI